MVRTANLSIFNRSKAQGRRSGHTRCKARGLPLSRNRSAMPGMSHPTNFQKPVRPRLLSAMRTWNQRSTKRRPRLVESSNLATQALRPDIPKHRRSYKTSDSPSEKSSNTSPSLEIFCGMARWMLVNGMHKRVARLAPPFPPPGRR